MKKELGFQDLRINLGGLSVYFLERKGDPKFPSLICIHGFLDGCYGFRKLVKHLNYPGRILIPDLPGYGRSRFPLISYLYQINIIADILYQAIKSISTTKTILVGHSMGGLISQKIVIKNQIDRKLKSQATNLFSIENLILLGSGSSPHPQRDEMRKILFPENETDINHLLSHLYFAEIPEPSWIVKKILVSAWNVQKNHFLADNTLKMEKEVFFGSRAKQIQIPTLIVVGEEDQLTTIKMMRNLKTWIRNSKLVILKHAKHAIHMEKAEQVAVEIRKFLKMKKNFNHHHPQ